jgi:hypothetical protein
MPPPKAVLRYAGETDTDGLDQIETQLAQMKRVMRDIREHGEMLKSEYAALDSDGNVIFTEQTLVAVGWNAFTVLHWLMMHGDREAAARLFEKCWGGVEERFSERIEGWSAAQAENALVERLAGLKAKGFSDEVIAEVVATILGEPAALPEGET